MISSAQEFRMLRTSDRPEEYARAAQDEAAPAVWLDVIAKFPDMREWVAHNKTIPHGILELLAEDLDEHVRCVVASKRKLAEALQLKLARDLAVSVRATLACNPKVTKRVLALLRSDDDRFVAEIAAKRVTHDP